MSFSVSIYLAILVVVLTFVYKAFTRNFDYWKRKGVIGPKPHFVFGNLKDVILQQKSVNVKFNELYDAYPNEKLVGVYRLSTPQLLVRDLDIVQHIMIKDFDNFTSRGTNEFGGKGLSQNLFITNGDSWRVLRTRFSPIFTSGKLRNMFYLIENHGDNFLKYIDSKLEKSAVQDAYKLMQKYTISTISACAFGVDIDLDSYDAEIYDKIDELIFTPSLLLEIEFLFPGIVETLKIRPFSQFITNYFYNLVKSVMKERNEKPSGRKDFIDLLLELRNAGEIRGPKKREDDEERLMKITDDLLVAQVFVFYAGGYETSASTVSFLLHELAMHQDIQNRVFDEINEVLEKNNNQLSYDCLKEMTYMNQVFNEVLRMYPVVDPLHRKARSAFQLPGTDVTVEKDSVIMVSIRGIHYDEQYYPEPHKFDPDRFSPGNVTSRHPCAYLPFGVGPRNCIGK
jgi:cytochrome P450 family 6